MLFSSIPFLYYFLPLVLVMYFIAPKSFKNIVLLSASLIFYGWGEPKNVFIMIGVIVAGYITGLLIDKYNKRPQAKLCLGVFCLFCVAVLIYYKYVDFFIDSFNNITGLGVPLLKIALPIGISFYMFQILSYAIDVYRGTVSVQKNPILLATYISMFPQLIAGPIVRYADVEGSLSRRTHSFELTSKGFRRFVVGLSKKVLIANQMAELCDIFRASDDKSIAFYWLYAVAFTLYIYFDFSGYSDMAIGLGLIFGFHFMENFNYPYISKSITEFWRRWHMSLGGWFRDYVYIPLGGNRVSSLKRFRNIFVVWMLTGLWHGAAINFLVWGLYFAVILLIEKHFYLQRLEKSKVISRMYTLFLVVISFVIFNAADMGQAMSDIGGMFGFAGVPLISGEFIYYVKSFAVILVVAIIGATPFVKKLFNKISEHKKIKAVANTLEPISLLFLMLLVTAYLVDGSFNPFLYFRF